MNIDKSQIEAIGLDVKSPWNPLYLAYCKSMGESDPAAQITKDTERWPGGSMAGFLLWIGEKIQEFDVLTHSRFHRWGGGPLTEAGCAVFARWLEGGKIEDLTE